MENFRGTQTLSRSVVGLSATSAAGMPLANGVQAPTSGNERVANIEKRYGANILLNGFGVPPSVGLA